MGSPKSRSRKETERSEGKKVPATFGPGGRVDTAARTMTGSPGDPPWDPVTGYQRHSVKIENFPFKTGPNKSGVLVKRQQSRTEGEKYYQRSYPKEEKPKKDK